MPSSSGHDVRVRPPRSPSPSADYGCSRSTRRGFRRTPSRPTCCGRRRWPRSIRSAHSQRWRRPAHPACPSRRPYSTTSVGAPDIPRCPASTTPCACGALTSTTHSSGPLGRRAPRCANSAPPPPCSSRTDALPASSTSTTRTAATSCTLLSSSEPTGARAWWHSRSAYGHHAWPPRAGARATSPTGRMIEKPCGTSHPSGASTACWALPSRATTETCCACCNRRWISSTSSAAVRSPTPTSGASGNCPGWRAGWPGASWCPGCARAPGSSRTSVRRAVRGGRCPATRGTSRTR